MPLPRAIAFLLCALFVLVCLSKARLIGDGMEYLAMAQGFVAHGSPELRQSDIAAFKAMPPKALARGRLEPDVLAQAFDRVKREGSIDIGFARGSNGGVHAIHFWMYSLLAAPFYALVTLLGQNPFMALVALNLAILGLTAWRVRAWLPATGLPELGLLLLMGPAYYAVWIGPELMTGCCVLLATLAALRRDLSLTVALAGLGATQNPSVAGLIVAAAAYALLYRRFPSAALLPPAPPRKHPVLLVLAGLAAASLPYIHNQAVFGMPSIIGRYYTDIGLVTPERLFSFVFDLNQGMLIGLPGLLACIALAAGRRRAWLLQLGIALLLTLGMALPTLGAVNWNSGALIVPRYVYWCAMPLLAVCLAGLVQIDARRRWLALAIALPLQGLAGWQAYRSKGPAFTAHGRLAAWVLDHAPRYYNPDPEIFLERERHREDLATHDQVVVHQGPNGPAKLMRFWSNSLDSAGLCAAGTHLAAEHVVTLDSGWRYYNAPLHCRPGPAPFLRIDSGAGLQPMLGAGWSVVQGDAVWNEGPRATLRVTLPAGRRARAIGLDGHYHHGVRASRVIINGIDLGSVALGQAPLALPPALASAAVLDVAIEHTRAPRPASASDPRALGFLLQGVTVEFDD
jgi:hypothetical protein